MRLTLNTIEYEDRKLYQVARLNMKTYKEELGGYVESRANLPTDMENSWIAPGAKVLGSTRLQGNITVGENTIIENSLLIGEFIIGSDVVISGSHIVARYCILIGKNSKIECKHFSGRGRYRSELFNDGEFTWECKYDTDLLKTNNYCKINCVTLSYLKAWQIVSNDIKWQEAKEKYNLTPQVFTEQARKWLREECLAQLNKGKIKR